MKAPYYLPEYRCGECHSAMYTARVESAAGR